MPAPACCSPVAAEQRQAGLQGRASLETAPSDPGACSDIQALREHCVPLSKHNKRPRNLGKSVEKPLYGVSSSSADTEGTVPGITEN